jgi:hypothetical protein
MPPTVPMQDEPDWLDGHMRPSDIIAILKRLPFPHGTTLGRPTVWFVLDRHVRDDLINALKPLSLR